MYVKILNEDLQESGREYRKDDIVYLTRAKQLIEEGKVEEVKDFDASKAEKTPAVKKAEATPKDKKEAAPTTIKVTTPAPSKKEGK